MMYQVIRVEPRECWRELQDFINEWSAVPVSDHQFAWKFKEGPFRPALVWIIRDPHNSSILATQFGIRRVFLHEGAEIPVLQLCDAFVHPHHRGKGLFLQILREVAGSMTTLGFAFAITFANENSAPAFRKLERMHELFTSQVFYFPIGSQNLIEQISFLPALLKPLLIPILSGATRIRAGFVSSDFHLTPISSFDGICEQWAAKIARGHCLFPLRTVAFLEWKAKKLPPFLSDATSAQWIESDGKRIGYCVLFRESRRKLLKVLDIIVEEPESQLVPALRAIVRFGATAGCDGVLTNVSTGLYKRALRSAGFVPGRALRCNLLEGTHSFLGQTLDESFWLIMPIDRDHFEY